MPEGKALRPHSQIPSDLIEKLSRIQANAVEEFQLAVTRQSSTPPAKIHSSAYIHPDRIAELRAKTSVTWDFTRLLALCDELNIAWQYGAHISVAMLTRSLLDHVPPIFSQKNFIGVAQNYSGSRSFKEGMAALQSMSRKIADGHLHSQIREKEVLPTANQVDFRSTIDLLLGEIVRIVR